MDLFLEMDLGYRLRRGSVAVQQCWGTVIAVYPRCGHIADKVVDSLPHDDRRVVHAALPTVLARIDDEMLNPATWETQPEKGEDRKPRSKRKRSPAATPQRVVRVGRSTMKAGSYKTSPASLL
jgi:hypothetical protein